MRRRMVSTTASWRVAALIAVAMQFLDPLQVDDRHDADQQIDVPRDIDLAADIAAVQAFVEQQIAGRLHRLPGVNVPGSLPSSFASTASWT